MLQTIQQLEIVMVLQIYEMCVENCCNEVLLCLIALAIEMLQGELHRIRPSNMYPPAGFYASGADDEFWIEHEDLFKHKFRFRIVHFQKMLSAIGFSDKFLLIGPAKKQHRFRADLCLLVVLRRLSYPIRFYDMVEDFGLPSNRLCEIFHSTVDILLEKFHAVIEFTTWLPFLIPIFMQSLIQVDTVCFVVCLPTTRGFSDSLK